MCTREDIKQEVEASERRMEAKLELSHTAIAGTISNFMGEVSEKLDVLTQKGTDSIIDRNSIHDALASLKTTTEAILEQTKKTNGRVSKLENWRSYILGALAALATLMLPIAFMIVSEIIKHIEL